MRRWIVFLIVAALIFVGIVAATRLSSKPKQQSPHLLQDAVAAIDRNDRATALRLLNVLLDENPDEGMARLYRGQIARDRGDVDEAVADWASVPDADPKAGAIARYLEGTVALERGHAERAEQLFHRAIELQPNYLKPRERLLEMAVVQVRREETRQLLEEIGRLRPWTVNELVFQIAPLIRATHGESGAGMMRAALKTSPGDRNCTLALARYLMEGEHDDEAIKELQSYIRLNPTDVDATALLGRALVRTGDLNAAKNVLATIPLSKSDVASVQEAQGELAVSESQWPEAIAAFARVVRGEPENLAAWHQLGDACRRAGKIDDAALILNQSVELDRLQKQALRLIWGNQGDAKLVAPILVEVGNLLRKVKRPDDAVKWFEKSLTLAPSPPAEEGLEKARKELAAARSDASILSQRLAALSNEAMTRTATTSPVADHSSSSPERSDPTLPAFRLTDVHESAGVNFQYFNGHSEFRYLLESTGGAVAVLDFDRDGACDLYFPQGCAIPVNLSDSKYNDQLFRNLGQGTFVNATAGADIRDYGYGQGVAVGDINGDGFPDLAVGNYGRSTIFLNQGDGTLLDATQSMGITANEMTSSLAFADFDNDGLVDLYAVNYVDSLKVCRDANGKYNACSPINFNGQPDRVFLNSGDGQLLDVTEDAGINALGDKGLGIVAADFDSDGKIDVFISNDTTPNFLFHNESEPGRIRFAEQALMAGVAVGEQGRAMAGMGIASSDLDANGYQDLFVTNFYLEPNSLFLNEGLSFVNDTRAAGIAEASIPWLGFGTQAVDLALRGSPDLFVANGHIDDFSADGEPWKMPAQLFASTAPGRFQEVSSTSGDFFQEQSLGRGVARLDFDQDSRPDLIVVHQDRPAALLHNDTAEAGNALVLDLVGVQSNREAIGAKVVVEAGGRSQSVWINGGDGYFASNERRLIIGLGTAMAVDRLTIQWPEGRQQEWNDLKAGRYCCQEGRNRLLDCSSRRGGTTE